MFVASPFVSGIVVLIFYASLFALAAASCSYLVVIVYNVTTAFANHKLLHEPGKNFLKATKLSLLNVTYIKCV